MAGDAKYWWGVLWLENLRTDWKTKIDDIVQFPYAYCIHDKDLDNDEDERKPHVHLIIAWNNTTTYNNAFKTFIELSAEGKKCCNKIERCKEIRYCYNYLIHDTESCRKAKKFQYCKESRIEGNNFDIGLFEQVSLADKQRMRRELAKFILDNKIRSYTKFYTCVLVTYDNSYEEVAASYSTFFKSLCSGFRDDWNDKNKYGSAIGYLD